MHPIQCYGECGKVQITKQMAHELNRPDLWTQWLFQAALQTIASEVLGADAVISPRGGKRHIRYCPDCQEIRSSV